MNEVTMNLTFALLGYRTTIKNSIGATPYLLVYGTEAVLPAEVKIPSLRIIQETELSDAQWIQNLYEQLMLIDEKEDERSLSWAALSY